MKLCSLIRKQALVLGLFALAVMMAATAGCRGNKSLQPPVHPNLNMDFQQKYNAQEKNAWFPDGRAMRVPVEGTVARGFLAESTELHQGRGPDGRLIDTLPAELKLDAALMDRGEERYNIYCAPCHAKSGYGDGIIAKRGLLVKPPSYHEARLQAMPLGYMYEVITKGKGTMMPYASQIIDPADRWAIAVWVRTLQASHRAALADLPADVKKTIKGGAQ